MEEIQKAINEKLSTFIEYGFVFEVKKDAEKYSCVPIKKSAPAYGTDKGPNIIFEEISLLDAGSFTPYIANMLSYMIFDSLIRYPKYSMTTLKKLQSEWVDEESYHQYIKELFEGLVNGYPELKEHRDFIEANAYGFGERAFWYAWKLIFDKITTVKPKLLEVGVYRGATLSLWRILKPVAAIYGITPLNTTGDYPDFDYAADIKSIHDHFNQPQPFLHVGYSQDSRILKGAFLTGPYDVVYVDGSHTYDDCLFDLTHYSKMVADNGFLVVDDAAHYTHQKWGEFQGHQSVSNALVEFMNINGADWDFIINVVHLMIYRKK